MTLCVRGVCGVVGPDLGWDMRSVISKGDVRRKKTEEVSRRVWWIRSETWCWKVADV